jgi:hypothetical protein
MHGFKSAILPGLKNCQNGTFETVHGIQIFFGQMMTFTKNIPNMSTKSRI